MRKILTTALPLRGLKICSQVNIYFNSLTVEHIQEEEAFTFMDLLAEIGGDLSLYIGITVLSFFEFFEFFVRFCYRAVETWK